MVKRPTDEEGYSDPDPWDVLPSVGNFLPFLRQPLPAIPLLVLRVLAVKKARARTFQGLEVFCA